MQDRRKQTRGGFTLIELLVVVAIISMLIAILSVGTRKVKVISKGLQQKSVFHAMTVGLELFSSDFDGYPNSQVRDALGKQVAGAQHLTEALLGRDNRGFEPRTGWYPMGDAMVNPNAPADLYTAADASLARRKGPYCEIKYGQVLMPIEVWAAMGSSDIYQGNTDPTKPFLRSPMVLDVFNRNDSLAGRIGMPVLYFKADSTKRFRVNAGRQTVLNPASAEYKDWVYNFDDNLPVLQLPWLRDPAQAGPDVHFKDPDDASKNHAQVFYEKITQQANPDQNFYKPYNASTFILISAGWDGIFGTPDDIVNYD